MHTDGVVAGHRVIRLLGTGDRATVYLGHSPSNQAVALKIFRADTAAAGIELDIAVLTSLAAPGLVHLLDVAQLADGRFCLVLERLAGGSLARYLVANPRLSPEEVVTLLAPVTVALRSMHAAGFAHGSLSQATVLLDENGRAVLTGFGAVSQFSDDTRERIRLLQADYARLGILMQSLVDALDPAHPQFLSGAAVLRRFEAATNPTGIRGSGASAAGAPLGTVLDVLEHDLFEWADAAPLRGFPSASQPDTNAPSRSVPEVRSTSRGVVPAPSASEHDIAIHEYADQNCTNQAPNKFSDNRRIHLDDGLAGPADPDFDDGSAHVDFQIDDRFDREFDDQPPRGRFGAAGDALRRFSDRWAVRGRGLQPRAWLGRALATVVDSHPLRDAGHVLRKRLHGHRRPLLVSVLGGASVFVLALTLFPVSGQADGVGADKDTVSRAPASDSPPATAPADAAGSADPPADPNTDRAGARPVADGAAAPDPAAIAGDDPVPAVVALLARRASCLATSSLVCLVDVDQTGSAMLALDSYDARERQQGRTGRNMADYVGFLPALAERNGDLAVVGLTPAPGDEKGQPASVLVVKGEGGWRLREIFDY